MVVGRGGGLIFGCQLKLTSLNFWMVFWIKDFLFEFESCGWWLGGWMGFGPSNFIVNQSPNVWIFGFKTSDLDFGLDNISTI